MRTVSSIPASSYQVPKVYMYIPRHRSLRASGFERTRESKNLTANRHNSLLEYLYGERYGQTACKLHSPEFGKRPQKSPPHCTLPPSNPLQPFRNSAKLTSAMALRMTRVYRHNVDELVRSLRRSRTTAIISIFTSGFLVVVALAIDFDDLRSIVSLCHRAEKQEVARRRKQRHGREIARFTV